MDVAITFAVAVLLALGGALVAAVALDLEPEEGRVDRDPEGAMRFGVLASFTLLASVLVLRRRRFL